MSVPFKIDFLMSMAEGVCVVNRDKLVTLWNPNAEKLTGFSKDDMVGLPCPGYYLPGRGQATTKFTKDECPLRLAFSKGKEVIKDVAIKRKDGSFVKVKLTIVPYSNAQGFFEGAIQIFTTDMMGYDLEENSFNERVMYIDQETGLVTRAFLESHYMALLKSNAPSFEIGLLLIDLKVLERIEGLKSRENTYTLMSIVATLLHDIEINNTDTVVARWSDKSFIILLNNTHYDYMLMMKDHVQKKLLNKLLFDNPDGGTLSFELMSTLIKSHEPLEKVVDILHAKSENLYL